MLRVFGLLDVSTSTPDALCPPLPEVEAALAGLVGGLPEGHYSVRYALQRSVSGSKSIRLELYGAQPEPLLARDLALDEGGCDEAARAIAVVVERYFERLSEEPADAASASVAEPPAPTVVEVSDAPAPPPKVAKTRETERPKTVETTAARQEARFLVRGLVGWTERKSPEVGVGFGFSFLRGLSGTLDLTHVLFPVREEFEETTLTNHSLRLLPSLRLEARVGDFVGGVSLLAPLGIEWANGSPLVDARTGLRAVPGLGGGIHISSSPAARWGWSLEAGAATTFPDGAKRFVVTNSTGQSVEVLAASSWWLGLRIVGTVRPFFEETR